jgi:hypothetical protein
MKAQILQPLPPQYTLLINLTSNHDGRAHRFIDLIIAAALTRTSCVRHSAPQLRCRQRREAYMLAPHCRRRRRASHQRDALCGTSRPAIRRDAAPPSPDPISLFHRFGWTISAGAPWRPAAFMDKSTWGLGSMYWRDNFFLYLIHGEIDLGSIVSNLTTYASICTYIYLLIHC